MAKKKSEERIQEEKIYPSLVLGLDISTKCIGASIVYDDGVSKPEIREITHITPKIPSGKEGIEALILRKEIFENNFLSKIQDTGITECVIESPLVYTAGNSNALTVAQLLQFNGLLSEAVYRVLGIIPSYISSSDARMLSFPQLLSIRKFNRKGEVYPVSDIKTALNENKLVLFGSYPFDCDKKSIMMDMVNEAYPEIEWVKNANGSIKKENYDACDSLICSLAYVNRKRYGEVESSVKSYSINECDGACVIEYEISVWDKTYKKKIIVSNVQITG